MKLNKRPPEVHVKAWGREEWIYNGPEYCGKILYFNKGAKFVQQLPNSAESPVTHTDDYLCGDGHRVFAHRINRLNFSRQKE